MTKFYVYTYFDPRTDLPFYVGKGQKYRARKHLHQTGNTGMARRLLALKAEGLEPEIDIYYAESEAEAFNLERLLIAIYGRLVNGSGHLVNILEAGERTGGFAGHRHSEAAKQRIREAQKGRQWSPEQRANQRAAAKKRTLSPLARQRAVEWGQSEEGRAVRSVLAKRTVTPERLAEMTARAAEVNRGRKASPETRARMSASSKGRVITDEARANMSAGQKRRYTK